MKRFAISTLFLLSALSLAASDFTGGIQLGPAFPKGDMKDLTDGSVGAQLVFFGRWDLGGGNMIRARLDGTSAKGKPDFINTPAGRVSNAARASFTASLGTLGADYLCYLDGNPRGGAYLGGGLAYGSNEVELELPLATSGTFKTSYSSGSLVYGLYAGYQFSPKWSVELTYRKSNFKKDITVLGSTASFTYSMPVVALVAGYTF